jgi:hypothetical protein
MKQFLLILGLVCAPWPRAWADPQAASPQQAPVAAKPATPAQPITLDKIAQENADKARALIEQGIKALGGETYLTIRDLEQQGRTYGFHAGRPTGGGGPFWSFSEFPDKERVELTKERDIAEVFVGNRGYEITYKGPRQLENKDLEDYLRRRRFSLDAVLRTWVNDPSVLLLYDGDAIAAQHPSLKVTLTNAQNESVSLFFDIDTHLPIKKSFEWRDPVDRQKNLEEEVYDNYKPVSGIMAPYSVTRFFNGDMSNQRFLNSVTINQGLNQAMFDPKSGYDPNKVKPAKKK